MVNRKREASGNGRFFMLLPLQVLIVVVALSVSCSSSDPQIMQVDARIIATFNPADNTVQERLHVQADIFDADGVEEVALLRVSHEADQLQWEIGAEALTHRSVDGQEWFGADTLTIAGSQTLPRGRYSLSVDDRSGRSDTREFTIPLLPAPAASDRFPVLSDEGLLLPDTADTFWAVLLVTGEDPEVLDVVLSPRPAGQVIPLERLPEALQLLLAGRDGRSQLYLLIPEIDHFWLESGPW